MQKKLLFKKNLLFDIGITSCIICIVLGTIIMITYDVPSYVHQYTQYYALKRS